MADFRQLALDFVLSDEDATLTDIAKQAATALQSTPPNTNPVARWVEAVQPWMPGSNGDDTTDESQEAPDWTSRAKALEFLSRTLDFLGTDVLKPSQVNLLVSFFGAMFDIDHKAGIMASATALSRIIVMKAFHPQSGSDIIDKICALKDDFPRQISKTRLAVYTLLNSLITNPEVAKDLQRKNGDAAVFMHNLIQLCQLERDPDCLMTWFGILRHFLIEYPTSWGILEEVYGAFKAYFPITLPRISESGITPDELKLQLRKCFSSTSRLASLALPFLIGKLDQGEGVTVNVKVDVLKTIRACVEEYDQSEESVAPYTNRIWGSLKYEVRNGEIEDTIWATLEVLKAVTKKLKGDELRDYTLTVTRDCVSDLSSSMYASAAGRLLVSVLSANPSAFVLMVAPAITHIKENLRHPKAPSHTQDLLKILRVILETRTLLVDSQVSDENRSDFIAVDAVFKSLYEDVIKNPVENGVKEDASYDDIKTATEAVQGAAALVCQPQIKSQESPGEETQPNTGRLLSEETCSQICDALLRIAFQSSDEHARNSDSDDLINETTKALQRAVNIFEPGFQLLLKRATTIIQSECAKGDTRSIHNTQGVAALLAYAGCSELPASPAEGMRRFLSITAALQTEIFTALQNGTSPKIWCALAAGIQSVVRWFSDACLKHDPKRDLDLEVNPSAAKIASKYFGSEGNDGEGLSSILPTTASIAEVRNDFLLQSLFLAGQLYSKAAAKIDSVSRPGKKILELGKEFSGFDVTSENQYLHLISDLAGFALRELNESQQASLNINDFVPNLFNDVVPQAGSVDPDVEMSGVGNESPWSWLTQGRLNVLFLGVIEALRPTVVAKLFDNGIGQEILLSGSSLASQHGDPAAKPVTMSILTVLANKYKIETLEPLVSQLEQHLASAMSQVQAATTDTEAQRSLEQVALVYAITAGILRRYSSKPVQEILRLLRDGPANAQYGGRLARRLEVLVAPQKALTKENYAIVKLLWMQKLYIEVVKPLLASADGSNVDVKDPLIKTNFSIGVLLMVKHMGFSIYEEDSDKILRISISIAQNIGSGPDTLAALQVLKNILVENPEKGQDHLRSLINICTASFSNTAASRWTRPEWLPENYSPSANAAEVQASCGKIALEIIGGLPKLYESRHLVFYVPQVERELSVACGHRVRDLRRSARTARSAWAALN